MSKINGRGKYADNDLMTVAFTPAADPRLRAARRNIAVTAVLLIAIALFGRLAFFSMNTGSDMEMFVFMGKLISDGGRVGVDLIDNKFPTVGLLMTVPYRLFGDWWLGYGLLGLTCSLAATISLARSARLAWGDVAYWPTAVAAAVFLNFHWAIFTLFQLEHVQVLFAALGAGAALNVLRMRDGRDAFALGLCAGFAALSKPSGMAVFVAAMTVVVFRREDSFRTRVRLVACGVAGLALPLLTVLIYLVGSDSLRVMPEIYRQVKSYASNSHWALDVVGVKIAHLLVIFGTPVMCRLWLERRAWIRKSYLPVDVAFVMLWLAAEFVGAALQGRMYAYHFLPLAGPCAILFGMIARRPKPAALVASVLLALTISTYGGVALIAGHNGVSSKEKVVAYLKDHLQPRDAAWMDEWPRLAVETDVRPGSRLPLLFLMSNDDAAPERFSSLLIDDLITRQPKYVVVATSRAEWTKFFTEELIHVNASPTRTVAMRDAIARLYDYWDEHYVAEQTIDKYTVMRRREEPAIATTTQE